MISKNNIKTLKNKTGVKIIPLMENNLSGDGITAEHGLCLYIETPHHSILADTGQSAKTWDNARQLGIDPAKVDLVFLSHGHYDHTGGLMSFTEINPHAKIYMKDTASGPYYSMKKDGIRYIGIDPLINQLPQLQLLYGDTRIDDELSVFSNVSGRRAWPRGNMRLLEKCTENVNDIKQDQFQHEQYLVIHVNEEIILISGCAHKGILNILDRFRQIYGRNPDLVMSGFHMVRDVYAKEDIAEITQVANELHTMDTIFYTGHCTGDVAFQIMKEIMGEQLHHIKDL